MLPPLACGVQHPDAEALRSPGQLAQVPLVVCCSDFPYASKVVSERIGSRPHLLQTPGNLLPHPEAPGSASSAAAATMEFTVELQGVRDVLVLGHTCCATLSKLLEPRRPRPEAAPWYRDTARTRYLLAEHYVDLPQGERLLAAVCENTLAQLERLLEYELLTERGVRLHAWVYDERDLQTYAYDPASQAFELLAASRWLDE